MERLLSRAMSNEPLEADWDLAGERLVEEGWVRLAGAIPHAIASRLLASDRPRWRPLPAEEGAVRQSGFGSYLPLVEAGPDVKELATWLTTSLSNVVIELGVPPVPDFNEVTWTRYPAGTGHITAHEDPPAYGGVIAVVTLVGSAIFRAWSSSGATEWETGIGDVVVLQGAGWPTTKSRCPLHEVEPPRREQRIIMTLRHNTRGAGGGYEL